MARGAVATSREWLGLATNGEKEGRAILFLSTVLAGLILDQGSKWLAASGLPLARTSAPSSGVSLSLVHNPGMLAGLGSTMPLLLELLTGLLLSLTALSAVSLLTSHRAQPRRLFALALLLAGGLGNLLDRTTTGGVIDFLQVGCLTLNVADLLLLAGGLLYGDPFQAPERVPHRAGNVAFSMPLPSPVHVSSDSWAMSAAPAAAPRATKPGVATAAASSPRRSRFQRLERRTMALPLR